MAIKVKRKPSRHQAAKEPDQIYTFSEQAFNVLERNKKIVLGSLAGVLVLIIVITVVARQSSQSSRESGSELLSAALLVDAPIGLIDDSDETRFESVEARAQAVRDAVARRVEDSDAPGAARLLDAVASVTLGDLTRAGANFQSVAESEGTPLISAVALQGLAATQASGGDLAAAEQSLETLRTAVPVLASYVDLERARLTEAAGDLEAALARYNAVAATSALVITDVGFSAANEGLVETARHRAAVLSVLLGQSDDDGEAEPDDEGPEEGASDEGGTDESGTEEGSAEEGSTEEGGNEETAEGGGAE